MTHPNRSHSRHESRSIAFQILYRFDLIKSASASSSSVDQDLETHFRHFEVAEPHREFVTFLVQGVLNRVESLDGVLQPHSPKWKISRLASVDRTLLRLGAFELIYGEERAPQVIINEAIELAKKFGALESPAFINAVLDAVAKQDVVTAP